MSKARRLARKAEKYRQRTTDKYGCSPYAIYAGCPTHGALLKRLDPDGSDGATTFSDFPDDVMISEKVDPRIFCEKCESGNVKLSLEKIPGRKIKIEYTCGVCGYKQQD